MPSVALGLCFAQPVNAWGNPEREAIRGVTVGPIESSQQRAKGYGTTYSAQLLDELVTMGANWISITPFGRIWSLKSTEILMDFEAPYQQNREAIAKFIVQARERGLQVMLIPHLWVETEGWRGEIDPGSDEGWKLYQASYRSFVMSWAKDAQAWGADGFSIGVECKSWSGRFGEYWTRMIEDIRSVFGGLLTYSSNWDEVDNVLFWDRLDLIGVNAFYPLAHHNEASYEQYLAGARQAIEPLGQLSRDLDMPVLFVEVGYTTRPNAAVEPWIWPDTMKDVVVDEWEQARAISAVLEAALPHRWLVGFFIWRYYSDIDDLSQEAIWGFSPHGKLAERVLTEIFNVQWGADPERLPWQSATDGE
ncbi:MAG: hypothetical protein JXA30_00140 [Deltaproteobacteria bacterium]|nr:hypothetical protein [Deltaproteobacteria bacterium]